MRVICINDKWGADCPIGPEIGDPDTVVDTVEEGDLILNNGYITHAKTKYYILERFGDGISYQADHFIEEPNEEEQESEEVFELEKSLA